MFSALFFLIIGVCFVLASPILVIFNFPSLGVLLSLMGIGFLHLGHSQKSIVERRSFAEIEDLHDGFYRLAGAIPVRISDNFLIFVEENMNNYTPIVVSESLYKKIKFYDFIQIKDGEVMIKSENGRSDKTKSEGTEKSTES